MSLTSFVTAVLYVVVAILSVWVVFQAQAITDLEHRVDELNCVHYIYEDGSAVHIDAEVAFDCLRRKLGQGWNETVLP